MSYDIYLDKVLLPVAPSQIKTQIKNKNKTIELINEGDVNLLNSSGLTEISFTVVLPNQKYPFARYVSGFKSAAYYLDVLEQYKKNKKPFQLIISRTLPSGSVLFYTNLKVSLEKYDIEDNVKEGFDTKVAINLKQYKEFGTKTVKISTASTRRTQVASASSRPAGAGANTAGTSYTIVSGDTLWNIAKKKMGSGSQWTTLYNANKTVIENAARSRGKASSNNGHWIYPGTVITIPNGSSSASSGGGSSSGGSRNNPPFSIINQSGGVIRGGFTSWSAVSSAYASNNGASRGWKIVDANKRVVSV